MTAYHGGCNAANASSQILFDGNNQAVAEDGLLQIDQLTARL